MNPDYPVYIVSKGRWKNPKTANALKKMGVPFFIAVEPQEYDQYADSVGCSNLIRLPQGNMGRGSIPARNFVWDHSLTLGAKRHWVMDDNISGFCRYNNNQRIPVRTGTIFKCCEDFTERFKNIGLSGLQYRCFATDCRLRPPFIPNTRIYSCILINNDLPYRWRGKYNEDTDLSIRALKGGWNTILFMAFLQDKAGTMTMKGGNTDELYAGDGRRKMAESLVEQHPDVVQITEKWGRFQHIVDYSKFKRPLEYKDDFVEPCEIVNEYGMKLMEVN